MIVVLEAALSTPVMILVAYLLLTAILDFVRVLSVWSRRSAVAETWVVYRVAEAAEVI